MSDMQNIKLCMSDMQNIKLSMPDSTVAEGSVDNTNAPGSSPEVPPTKRPRLIGPELNQVDQIDPESTTVDIVEGRTVGTQTTFPERVVMCVICSEVEATWVLVPCGHRCVCEICLMMIGTKACTSETFKKTGHEIPFHKDCKCPLCRTVVKQVVTLHE